MSMQMDETFAAALRDALVDHVTAGRRPRRATLRRWRWPTLGVVVLAAAGGGTALAVQLASPAPGGDNVTPLAASTTVTATGTRTIELGPPPAGANRINIRFRCLSAGKFTFADGAGVLCDSSDTAHGGLTTYHLPLTPGQHTTIISTSPQARWTLTATYVAAHTTPWGVNAKGETYGIVNGQGMPDLVQVIANNGKIGYAYRDQILGPQPTSPEQALRWHPKRRAIPVYESDGRTVIGEYGP